MLKIYYGTYNGDNYIYDPDTYFNNQCDSDWITDPLSVKMIEDIDKSKVIGNNLIESSRLGPIPPQWLSGGVKTLILINNDPLHVYNASACGNNCAKWLLEISSDKDRLVRLGYMMDFGQCGDFSIYIENNHQIVTNMDELMTTVFKGNYLRE